MLNLIRQLLEYRRVERQALKEAMEVREREFEKFLQEDDFYCILSSDGKSISGQIKNRGGS